MSLTINPTLLKRKQRKDGTIPIYIRITENRKSRYKSTGISIHEKHWNEEKLEIRTSHRRKDVLNRKIRELVIELESNKIELEKKEKLNLDALKNTIEKKKDPRLITSHLNGYINHVNNEKRYWQFKHFKVIKGNILRFIDTHDMSDALSDLNSDWIEAFQDFLLTEGGPSDKSGHRKGNSNNTVRKKLERLRGFILWLIKNKHLKHDPFATVDKVKADRSSTKTKLSHDQIKRIQILELEPWSKIWHVRNYFLFSFYNAGIRFGDLCALKWKNLIDGRLIYIMFKTGSKKSIKQLNPMLQILDLYRTATYKPEDYIFPILKQSFDDPLELRRVINQKNVLANKQLKRIAKKAGIESNISFHVSRHSFAHFALKKGMDLYSISKALGHSDLKITEQYLKSFDEEKLDTDMEGIFA